MTKSIGREVAPTIDGHITLYPLSRSQVGEARRAATRHGDGGLARQARPDGLLLIPAR